MVTQHNDVIEAQRHARITHTQVYVYNGVVYTMNSDDADEFVRAGMYMQIVEPQQVTNVAVARYGIMSCFAGV